MVLDSSDDDSDDGPELAYSEACADYGKRVGTTAHDAEAVAHICGVALDGGGVAYAVTIDAVGDQTLGAGRGGPPSRELLRWSVDSGVLPGAQCTDADAANSALRFAVLRAARTLKVASLAIVSHHPEVPEATPYFAPAASWFSNLRCHHVSKVANSEAAGLAAAAARDDQTRKTLWAGEEESDTDTDTDTDSDSDGPPAGKRRRANDERGAASAALGPAGGSKKRAAPYAGNRGDDDDDDDDEAPAGAGDDAWSCGACTFVNRWPASECEMCGGLFTP